MTIFDMLSDRQTEVQPDVEVKEGASTIFDWLNERNAELSQVQAPEPPPQISQEAGVEESSSVYEEQKLPDEYEEFFKELDEKEAEKKDYEERSFLGKTLQNVAGVGARGLETLVGAAGDLQEFADFMLVDLPEYMAGQELTTYRNVMDKLKAPFRFPTSKELKEKVTEPLTGKYTEPQGEGQKFAQETFQDIVRFFTPGMSGNRFTKLSPFSKVMIPVSANVGKEIAKDLDMSERTQDLVKMGLMLVMDLSGRGQIRQYAGHLIDRAESLVKPGIKMDATHVLHRLKQAETHLARGGQSPKTTRALEAIQDVRNRVENGQIEVKDLMSFRKKLNDVIETGGGFEIPGATKPGWTKNLHLVKNRIVNSVNRELNKTNPEAARLWREGNQAFSVFSKSSKIGDYVRAQTKKPFVSNTMKIMFPPLAYTAGEQIIEKIPQALAVGAPVVGGIKAYQIMSRSMKSPVVRKYYEQVMKAAMKENSILLAHSIKKLDKALQEQEVKDPILSDLVEAQ